MSIRPVKYLIQIPGKPSFYYRTTDDGAEFIDLDEAVEHENKLHEGKFMKPAEYEQIWSIQEAINKAVAENRTVKFIWNKTNKEIKKDIIDIKGCKLRKPDKDSNTIAVIPPSIDVDTFDFSEE